MEDHISNHSSQQHLTQEKLPLVEAGLPFNEFNTLFHSDGASLPNAPCDGTFYCFVPLVRPS